MIFDVVYCLKVSEVVVRWMCKNYNILQVVISKLCLNLLLLGFIDKNISSDVNVLPNINTIFLA